MNKLSLHLVIVILCCFSFLLLAGSVTFRKEFNSCKNRGFNVKDYAQNNMGNIKKIKEAVDCKAKNPDCKNGR